MISDYSAFQRHNRELGIDLISGGKESFVFSLNIPTGIYFEVVANCCALGELTDEMAKAELILESAALLMIVSIVLCKLVKVSCISASYDLHYPMT